MRLPFVLLFVGSIDEVTLACKKKNTFEKRKNIFFSNYSLRCIQEKSRLHGRCHTMLRRRCDKHERGVAALAATYCGEVAQSILSSLVSWVVIYNFFRLLVVDQFKICKKVSN